MMPLPLAHVLFAIAPPPSLSLRASNLRQHCRLYTPPTRRHGIRQIFRMHVPIPWPVFCFVAGPPVMEERDVDMPAQFANVVQVETNRSRSQPHHVDTLDRGPAARSIISHFSLAFPCFPTE
ncbi:hypothetical protein LZ30DRAFT_285086 [Colletotrichum cereale]|nr:hypothetical protein LZ30DRAFT_285086 [Colletotrichum cereale]